MDLSHFSFFKFKIHSPNKSVSHTIDVEKKKKKKDEWRGSDEIFAKILINVNEKKKGEKRKRIKT